MLLFYNHFSIRETCIDLFPYFSIPRLPVVCQLSIVVVRDLECLDGEAATYLLDRAIDPLRSHTACLVISSIISFVKSISF